MEELNYESRQSWDQVGVQIVRGVFISLLATSEVVRMTFISSKDELIYYLLDFATWTLYLTMYSIFVNLQLGIYVKKCGFINNTIKMVCFQKHNLMLFSVVVSVQTCALTVYWMEESYSQEGIGFKEIFDILSLLTSLVIVVVDFVCVGWVFKLSYALVTILFLTFYISVNGIYSTLSHDSIYKNLDWKSSRAAEIVIIMYTLSISTFIIFWFVAICRYKKFISKKEKSESAQNNANKSNPGQQEDIQTISVIEDEEKA